MANCRFPLISYLRQRFDYDPLTGHVYWREQEGPQHRRWNVRYAGTIAGASDRYGYVNIKIDERSIGAHRIIMAMQNGWWPEVVDHINGKPWDNRLENLRAVTHAINQKNQKRHKSNKSGITGVCWTRAREQWMASIKVNGRSLHLGFYDDINEAAAARKAAEKEHGFTGRV